MTTGSGWESSAVVTKKSMLLPEGVLDPPLLEIKMGELNEHHISGRQFH